ncbi:unnamed protein product [Eruca vesicaria subsp. sativa]|uniref:F-box domain-containing protein n=1 Tax=Eruca vesicaria subsp. sativa TaxID=29727 RepID=A0ABC8J516_ERUVS|nr:unnamed protein product [Eruca vesicaria subsp. sativa]
MTSKTNGGGYEQSSQPSLLTSFPEDIVVDILARVPRHDYPALSLVSKQFRSLVTSHEIYSRRSLLRCTENCIYVIIRSRKASNDRLYILRRKADGSHCLVHISSLLDFPKGESFVTVGSMIYGFGGRDDNETLTLLRAFSIDCRSHTVKPLPNMPIPMTNTVAAFLDGKVYVFGKCSMKSQSVVVFNIETQMWEPVVIKPDTTTPPPRMIWGEGWMRVMANKIYMKYNGNMLVYVPKESKWETDDVLSSKYYDGSACVLDDVMYYYDSFEKCLNRYDPKERRWGVVKGLDELLAEMAHQYLTMSVPFGRNLVLFFIKEKEKCEATAKIWCAEISLGRHQGDEVWGKVEWCSQVVVAETMYFLRPIGVIV